MAAAIASGALVEQEELELEEAQEKLGEARELGKSSRRLFSLGRILAGWLAAGTSQILLPCCGCGGYTHHTPAPRKMPPLRIVHTRSGASATLGDAGDVVSVGRKEMCEICIPGQTVSSCHFKVSIGDGGQEAIEGARLARIERRAGDVAALAGGAHVPRDFAGGAGQQRKEKEAHRTAEEDKLGGRVGCEGSEV